MKREPDPAESLAVDEGLAADVRFLADPRLLAAVHTELRRSRLPGDASAALLRAGFLHGLRDGGRARHGDGISGMAAPILAMRFASATAGGSAGRPLALHGSWPAKLEAEAVLMACGRPTVPSCLLSTGYTSGWMSALWESDVLVVERSCAACGDDLCRFEARDAGAWLAGGESVASGLLAALPFGVLRDRVDRELREVPDLPAGEAFDPASPAIHVWGPVMVVPYAGDETAVAVEAVASDPAAAGVTVVVVDLQGAIIDDGFGAVALERVVEVIEGRGAEAVLAGISPLSERVVAGLGCGSISMRKDLRSAIALGFQIAESQRGAI
jgi:anti-anti-sigma regulatory factor